MFNFRTATFIVLPLMEFTTYKIVTWYFNMPNEKVQMTNFSNRTVGIIRSKSLFVICVFVVCLFFLLYFCFVLCFSRQYRLVS